jgi:hypothetical protein
MVKSCKFMALDLFLQHFANFYIFCRFYTVFFITVPLLPTFTAVNSESNGFTVVNIVCKNTDFMAINFGTFAPKIPHKDWT